MYDDDLNDWDENESSPGVLAKTLRNVGVLVVICLVIAFIVSAGDDQMPGADQRSAVPAGGTAQASLDAVANNVTEMKVAANSAGHFVMDGEVGPTKVRFLVDTGATKVVLSRDDAVRAGLRPEDLRFNQSVSTANGEVRVAPVTLRRLRVGQIVLNDVEAIVNSAPMRVSLLGMSFLQRLDGWQVKDDHLYLAW